MSALVQMIARRLLPLRFRQIPGVNERGKAAEQAAEQERCEAGDEEDHRSQSPSGRQTHHIATITTTINATTETPPMARRVRKVVMAASSEAARPIQEAERRVRLLLTVGKCDAPLALDRSG